MMINLTIWALSTTLFSHSPLFSPISSTMKSELLFQTIQAKNFFTSFIIDYSSFASLAFSHSSFTNFLNSPISVNNNEEIIDEVKIVSKNITKQLIKSNAIFTVIGCNFINCLAGDNNKRGGAIYFVYNKEIGNCLVTVYSSTFDKCRATNGDGGAIFVCNKIGITDFDPNHTLINYFNSSYCCYSNCTAYGMNRNEGYGPVMFIFASLIEIYYSTAVECPAENEQSYGAQIDLKSYEIFSSYINSTKGKSEYCCAVEYRQANKGNFKYQTFVDLTGGYLTSFTNLNNKLDISFCNYVNNTIVKPVNTSGSFIYVYNSDVSISNFCFVGIKIPENKDDFEFVLIKTESTDAKHFVKLENSFIENNIKNYLNDVTTTNVVFYDDNEIKSTNAIDLLHLGQCEGDLTPPPTIFSSTFTPTSYFTKSSEFTNSDEFSESVQFTSSNSLMKSYPSKPFNPSSHFTDSKEFSRSFEFTHSEIPFVDRGGNIDSSNKGGKVTIIASVAAASAAAVIAAVVVFFIIKKRRKIPTSDINLFDENNNSITVDNTLQSVMDEDDPFAADFKK